MEMTAENRRRMMADETPEQAAARRAEKNKRRNEIDKRKRAQETPEQSAARRAAQTEWRHRRKQVVRAAETPEQRAARLLKHCEQTKRSHKRRLSRETPEQAAARRQRNKERKTARLLIHCEQDKKSRKKRLSIELPEQAAARRAKENERNRMRHATIRAAETPEKREARLQIERARRRRRQERKIQLEIETPEKREARLQIEKERRRRRNERKTQEKIQRLKSTTQNSTVVRQEDGDITGSSTWSTVEPSEGSFSLTTTEGSCTTRTTNEAAQQILGESILIKNEPSQDSWSFCEASESSFVTQELFQDNRDSESSEKGYEHSEHKLTASNKVKVERDEHLIYGAYIADRLRKCKRNDTEVNVAKNHIENIMFDLSTGAYSYISSLGGNEINQITEAPSLLKPNLIAPVVQAIIVKEEVDL